MAIILSMRFGLPIHPYSTLMIIAALVSLLLAARAWYGTKKDISWSFAMYQTAIFVWCVFRVAQMELPYAEAKFEALKLQYLGIVFIPSFIMTFSLAMDRRPLKGWWLAASILPSLVFAAIIGTDYWHHLFWAESPHRAMPLNPRGGPLFWAFIAYAYAYTSGALFIVVRVVLRSRGALRYWLARYTILLALPLATNVVFVFFFLERTPYDPTPAVFALSGLFQAFILNRFDILDALPFAKSVILESIESPIIVVDAEGIVVGANPEAGRFAREGEGLEGRDIAEIVPILRDTGAGVDSLDWFHGGVDYLITCYSVRGGHGRGRILTFRDVSAQTKANREIEEARARADAANAAKSAFVATVSHELRNPINAILGLADLDLRCNPPPELRGDLEIISSSGNILLGLVNDLLDLSKIEAGKMELEAIDFDLHEKAVSVLRAFRPAVEKKGLFLDIVVAEGTPRLVRGDPLRYGQVLMNLVSNAIKFTESGAVIVDLVPDQRSDPGDDPRGLRVRTSVSDSGIGIPADRMPLLFKPFSQTDPSVSRRFGGTGLGLSICEKLVSLFGGEIEVSSVVGRGSIFSFTARFEAGAAAPPVSAPGLGRKEPGRILRVLVVDDDPINATVARRYVERAGHTVACANTGGTAIDLASRGDFDLVLLDLGLPDMSGFEACRRIREARSARRFGEPFIAAMTARADSDIRGAVAAAGMGDCVLKPLDPASLEALLERVAEKLAELGPRAAASVSVPLHETVKPAAIPKPAAPDSPLVDERALLDRLDGDASFMRELLGIFVEESPGRRTAFATALDSRDLFAIQKLCHALKGASLTLCANPLAATASQCESACVAARASQTASASALPPIVELLALLDATTTACEAILSAGKSN